MDRLVFRALLATAGVVLMALPVWAHHSFAAAYDVNKPVILTGVVTQVRIANPHTYFFVDVTDQSGKVTNWGFEGNTPTSLIRSGYKPDTVKVGDKVTIKGSHAREMSVNMGAVESITLADGRSFIVGHTGKEADTN